MDEDIDPTVFATKDDVMQQVILEVLDNPADYDVLAILDRTHEWTILSDEDGSELLNTGGFRCTVTMARFWEIVAEEDISEQPEEVFGEQSVMDVEQRQRYTDATEQPRNLRRASVNPGDDDYVQLAEIAHPVDWRTVYAVELVEPNGEHLMRVYRSRKAATRAYETLVIEQAKAGYYYETCDVELGEYAEE